MSATKLNVNGVEVNASNPLPVTGAFSATTAGTYNTTAPTMTNGASGPLQIDVNGNLKVAGSFAATTTAQYLSSPPTLTSGNSGPLQTDVNGNLKIASLPAGTNAIGSTLSNIQVSGAAVTTTNPVPIIDAYLAPVATAWTSATAANTAVSYNTQGMDTVIVTLVANASTTSGSVIFEVYDGVTWLPVKAPTIIDYTTVGTVAFTGAYSKGFQVPVAGFPSFRVRLATVLPASATLAVTVIISSAPDVSLVTVGLDPAQPLPTGTNNIGFTSETYANVLGNNTPTSVSGAPTVTGTTAAIVAPARAGRKEVTLVNEGTASIRIGGSGVTSTAYGILIVAGESITVTGGAAIYGASATASAMSALEVY